MIEDEIYRTSSQYRLWSFTHDSLHSLRNTTNAVASDRVRAAIRRTQQPTSSTGGTPNPSNSDTDSKRDEKSVDCLTPEEEQDLVRYYCEQTMELGERYRPPIPTIVRSTAIQFLRRFYLTNSPMTYHPKTIMSCALFLATKTENYYMSLRHFADGLPADITGDDVIAPEFLLMQGLRFTFDVRHAFRGLEGGIMELQAMATGMGEAGPFCEGLSAEDLKRGLLSVPPPPRPESGESKSITDRLGRAHTTTRETLKTAAQMTDAYFLYTPSQIWLSAFYLADRPLAEFYLDTKLGPAAAQNPDGGDGGILQDLRAKLFKTLSDCAILLQSYTPSSADAEMMKNLKRIAKKRHHCANPEKANLGARKRDPGVSAGGEGTSESDVERMAKKRKLEREKMDKDGNELFGGELVMNRTKDSQQNQQQEGAG